MTLERREVDEVRMTTLREFRRKEETLITAVRLDLETDGFSYQKWGGTQRCKRVDWLVNNGADTYTIDADTFARTYRVVSSGVYRKVARIWAERAETAGVLPTKEGSTAYAAGDMLVFNDAQRADGYAMSAETFDTLYEPAQQ